MRYSIEPKDRTYVKGYRFLPLSNKYGQKRIDSAEKSTMDAIKTS